MKHSLKWLLITSGLLVLFPVAGFVFQETQSHREQKINPPLGKLYSIGSHKMHLVCRGQGPVTVVFEAGFGQFSKGWEDILEPVSKVTRACSYDRSGMGWSEESDLPRNSENIANELSALLKAAAIEGPFILIAHSMGGLHARVFAGLNPDLVKGLILIDASHEKQWDLVPHHEITLPKRIQYFRGLYLRALFGLNRLVLLAGEKSQDPGPVTLLKRNPKFHKTQYRELEAIPENQEIIRSVRLKNDLPLVIITAGIRPENKTPAWFELQKDLLSLSTSSRQVFAWESRHFVQNEQPELVLEEIFNMIDLVQK